MEELLARLQREEDDEGEQRQYQRVRRIVPRVWRDHELGLVKVNLGLEFVSMAKATLTSTVTFELEQVDIEEGLESCLLRGPPGVREYKIGTAETPIDCYVEVVLSRMLIGEYSRCHMERRTSKKMISFTIRVKGIKSRRHVHQLTTKELFTLATDYKERGVRMFKKWPIFAHIYFGRAFKLLNSYPDYKCMYDCSLEEDGIDGKEVMTLVHNVRHNLAACLMLEKNYGEVICLLDHPDDVRAEKAMYRKAQALYHVKRYEDALECFQELDWEQNPAMVKLNAMIRQEMVKESQEYTKMVRKMFQ